MIPENKLTTTSPTEDALPPMNPKIGLHDQHHPECQIAGNIPNQTASDNQLVGVTHQTSPWIRKAPLAKRCKVSTRTIDNWMAQSLIPFIKTSSRCVIFNIEHVDAALRAMEIQSIYSR